MPELGDLLRRADATPADQLFAALYGELHRIAEQHLRRGGSALTLSPTTLLHESYLNIAGRAGLDFPDQTRFLAYASRAMRGLVIDYVRARRAQKRGSQFEITLVGDQTLPSDAGAEAEELGRLSEALDELGTLNPALSQLVDLHFFCGFTFAEIAGMRGVSDRTIKRDWRKARLMLHGMLHSQEDGEAR